MQLTTANVDQFAWGRILLPGDILRVGLSGDEECKNEGNVESHLTTPCQVGRRRVSNVKQAGMERSGERRGGEEWRSRGAADHLKKKKDVGRTESHFVNQDVVRARADRYFAFDGVRLPLFDEGHHHHGRAVVSGQPCLLAEYLVPFH